MRDTPVIVFINKMDREGQDAFELLDEIESKLLIKVKPMSWRERERERESWSYF